MSEASTQRSVPWSVILGAAFLCAQTVATAGTARAVAELFTSQGCSSCPPADAFVGRLHMDPAVVVLSFHVNYWDGPGWKDPFSSQAGTDRQYAYARGLNERSVFTPQLIVNGTRSLVGSQEGAARQAITAASTTAFPVQVELSRGEDGRIALTLEGPAIDAELWEVEYVQHTATRVRGGENGGRTLETYNDVTRIRKLGTYSPGTSYLPALKPPENGLAVLAQAPGTGRMLGAGAYEIR